jgi:hypothetical protein
MVDSIDWSDEKPQNRTTNLRGLKMAAYRPGKAYLAFLSGVREMIKELAFFPRKNASATPTPAGPSSLGQTEMDLSRLSSRSHPLEA